MDSAERAYAREVGRRLRLVRKQQRYSLQAVEALSAKEFKASVLGAYERGKGPFRCRGCGAWQRSIGSTSSSCSRGRRVS